MIRGRRSFQRTDEESKAAESRPGQELWLARQIARVKSYKQWKFFSTA